MIAASVLATLASSSLAQPVRYSCAVLTNADPMMGRMTISILPHPERGHVWTTDSADAWLFPSLKEQRDVISDPNDNRPIGQPYSHGTSDAFRLEFRRKNLDYVLSLQIPEGIAYPADQAAVLIHRTETYVVAGSVEYTTHLSAGVCDRKENKQP